MADIAGDRINYRIDVDGLSQLDGMKGTIAQIERLMPRLNKSVQSAQQSIKRMNDATSSSRADTSLNKQKRGFDDVTVSAKRTGQEVERTRIKTSKLGETMRRSTGKPYFKSQTRDLNKLGGQMQSFGAKATAISAGIAAGAGLALKTATNLQNRYKVINNLAVTGGERSAEVQRNVNQMQKDGTKYSDTYGISQKKIASGYETLIRRGYTSNQALGSQKAYLQGAIASGDSYTDVVNNAASAIEQFGMKTNTVKGMALASKTAINEMAYSADLTATSFADLGEAMKFAGPDAHAAHQSLHNTAAALGDLSNYGIDGSQAGTSMRQIYQRLINPPAKGKAPNAMKQIGLNYSDFRDSKNELLPIQDIFGKIANKMKGMSQTDKGAVYAALFGTNASSAAQALGASYKQVDKLDKKVKDSSKMNGGKGYVSQLSQKNLDTLEAQWKRLKTILGNTGVDLANTWMPSLTKVTKAAADLLQKFQKLPEPAKKFISVTVGLAAIVGPLALAAGSLIKMRVAMEAMSKLGGEGSEGGLGILDQVSGFLGLGQGKNNPKGALTRSGSTHFSTKSRVPGSSILNGWNWKGIKSDASTVKESAKSTRLGRFVSPAIDLGKASVKSVIAKAMSTAGKGIDFAKLGLKAGGSKAAGLLSKIPGLGKAGSLAKGGLKLGGNVLSKVPVLDVAMAGTNLIGMNKKNAGKKVGSAGGMLAGGAIGSMFGPIGGMAGAVIGQSLGTKFGSIIQKSMPKSIKKSLGKISKNIGKTFKNLLKPFKATVKSISKVWSSATKGISKSWSKYVIKPLSGKNSRGAIKDTMKVFKAVLVPTMKIAGAAFKVFGAVVKTAIKIVAHVVEGLIKTITGVFSLISDIIHGRWKNIWKDAVQIFSGIFGTLGNVLKDILKTVWDGIADLGSKIATLVKHPVKTVSSWFGGGDTPKGKGHAKGGLMSSQHVALVGEQGPEMAYHPGKGYMRWLGKNGPTLARVNPGERILNAKDSAGVANGGAGRGTTLPGYAKGTAKLVKSKKKGTESINFDAFGGSTKKSTKSLGKLSKGNKKTWQTIQRDTNKTTKKINKATGKSTDQLRKNTVHDFDSMQKGTLVQMKQMHKGMNAVAKDMVEDFYKIFGKLDNYAHKAMASAIKQLNGGIRGINTVLNKFGGGGSVLPMIHYAQGSKGPISKHTMAVVNDAKVGPRQEAIVKANGRALLPKGNDVTVPLAPGDEVLNGTETAQLQDVGALPHFAKGTGGLKRLITSSNKDPKSAWNRDFTSNVNAGLGTALGNGLLRTSKGASSHVGLPWNGEVWSQFKDAMSGSGGGPVLHSPGAGWSKTSGFGHRTGVSGGFSSHDGNDFSGAKTVHALQDSIVTEAGAGRWLGGDGVGEVIGTKGGRLRLIYQELNGKSGHGATLLVHAGDHVKQGQAIAKLGPSGTHVHIGATTQGLWDHGGSSTKGWLDVTKLHGSFGNPTDKKKSKNPALTKLVKSELGSRLKWVSDKLGEDAIGSIGSLSLSGGLGSRARTLAAALKKLYPAATNAGIAAVLGNWEFESGGLNPGAINPGGGASGLGQWLGGRKTALINYARRHHKNWKSAGAQLEYALHGEGSDSALLKSVLRGKGSVASLAAKFSNQWERGGYTGKHVEGARKIQAALHANGGWAKNGAVNVFGEAKGENEVAVNTQRPSADPLLLEAMSDRANKAPNSVFGQLKAFTKMQHEFAKMKESQTTFTAKTSDSSAPKKSEMSLRPQIIYSPKITITGSGDPKETAKIFAKQSTKDQRNFESMMNDFCARIMAAE
ncbi:phage tail tape measure protein [Levilactobacillus tangyuanensis]|uniref:Phage tail tape measure protein n=1 Tax=Levilactobacillus tangyuanensis TaxID=2486021 RepID=A0ABW1TR38_9LACO|nr:phage tail tape measure protein [Levilactobacillus tangyuanensis]